ncbi:MAG: hypothetical protein MJ162_00800 [Treponema sp.]|nr:hypothetical protein [Treponema sp.]
MDKEVFYKEIYNRYGAITRARNCFLYTKKGVRLTDLNQENGRAILGWDAGNAFTHLKNTLNRGITGSFITEDVSRVEKAMSALLGSERTVYFYSSKSEALKAALVFSAEGTSFYKPWNSDNSAVNWASVEAVVFAPALPWTETVYIVAVDKAIPEISRTAAKSISVPYPIEAAIARSIYNLIEALQVREEKDWFIYDTVLTKYWTRKGPYLFPKIPENKYDEFVIHCMDLGIVINPEYNNPSIVPYGADKGVFTGLKNKPFSY